VGYILGVTLKVDLLNCRLMQTRQPDLFHEDLHVLPLLEDEAAQVVEGDVTLHVDSEARLLHVELG